MDISSASAHPLQSWGVVSGHGWRGNTVLCLAGSWGKVSSCLTTTVSASWLLLPNWCFRPKIKILTIPTILEVPHTSRHPAFWLQSPSSGKILHVVTDNCTLVVHCPSGSHSQRQSWVVGWPLVWDLPGSQCPCPKKLTQVGWVQSKDFPYSPD